MEDIDCITFFKFASGKKLRISIPETGILQGDTLDVIGNEDGIIEKLRKTGLKSYLEKMIEENELWNRIHGERNLKICQVFNKGHKSLVLESRAKELLLSPRGIEAVQKYIHPYGGADRNFVLKTMFINSQYLIEVAYGRVFVEDPIVLNQFFDVVFILIHSFETFYVKRVVSMSLEFLKDTSGKFLLSHLNKCILVEAKFTIDHPLTSFEDIESLIKTVSKSQNRAKKSFRHKQPSFPLLNKDSSLYLFRRGQLRNKLSKIDSPIRFQMQSPKTPINECQSKSENAIISSVLRDFVVPKPSHFETPVSRLSSKTKSTKVFVNKEQDSDFIKLIMKTYYKKSNLAEQGDFGLSGKLSTEDFNSFLNTISTPLPKIKPQILHNILLKQNK